ncbi:uncharacterized protein LOC135484451 [Lineus longissimus]|uniref:uncharacterized protein LOC135484451 n=1 Tax=Lineus longissimus TaxID=88925 RepID=UPI002B4F42AF
MNKAEVRREIERLEREYEERKKKLQRSDKAAERRKHVKDKLKEISTVSNDDGTELSKGSIRQTKKRSRLTFAEPLVDGQRDRKHIVSPPQNICSLSHSSPSRSVPANKSISDRHLDVKHTTCFIENPVVLELSHADCDKCLVTENTTEKLFNDDRNYVSKRICKVARITPVSEAKEGHGKNPLSSADSGKSKDFITNQNLGTKNSQDSLTVPETSATQESSSSALSEDSLCSIKRRGRKKKHGHWSVLKDSVANPSLEIQTFSGTTSGSIINDSYLDSSSQSKESPSSHSQCSGAPAESVSCNLQEDTWDSESDLFEPCSQDLIESQSSSQDDRSFFPIFPSTPVLNSRDFSLPDEEFGTEKLRKLSAKSRASNLPDKENGRGKLRKLSDSGKSATFNSSQSIQAKSNRDDMCGDSNFCSGKTSCQDTKNCLRGSSQIFLSEPCAVSEGETQFCHVSVVSTDVAQTCKHQKNDRLRLVDCIPIRHCKCSNPVHAMTAGIVETRSSKIPYLVVCSSDQVQVILHRDNQWFLLCQWKSEMDLSTKSVHAFPRRSTIAFAVLSQSDQSCSARIFACDIRGNKLETLGNLCEMTVKTTEESPSIHCIVQSELELIMSTSARGISVLRKFTFNEDYTLIDAHVIFPRVSGHLNSLVAIPTIPSLVLSTSSNTAYLWNTNSGTLLTSVQFAVILPVRSCIAAFEEQGFLFLPVLASSKVKDEISLVIVNPKSGRAKSAISFETDRNKRIVSLSIFKDRLLGLHPSGDVTVWDIYSGDVIGSLDKGCVQCLTTVGNCKNLFMMTVSAKQDQCCVNIYRDIT